MLFFPNCKINLGLYVTEKRRDGYHNIESVFYPVGWCDALEIVENRKIGAGPIQLLEPPGGPDIPLEQNLIYMAWKLVSGEVKLPALSVHWLKNIPTGAGLGGVSSDAAHTLLLLNKKFGLGLGESKLLEMAAKLGSDCPFFIRNRPQLALGRGEILEDIALDLSAYFLLLVNPGLHSDTARAYQNIAPQSGRKPLREIVSHPDPLSWQNELVNDFQEYICSVHPLVKQLIHSLYAKGACYAAMSGSGTTVYGLFREKPKVDDLSPLRFYLQTPRLAYS